MSVSNAISIARNDASITSLPAPRRGRPPKIKDVEPVVVPLKHNIVDYVYETSTNGVAASIGAIFGAWIPIALYSVVHTDLSFEALASRQWDSAGCAMLARLLLVLVGFIYSVISVATIVNQAKPSRYYFLAITYTLLTEGAMVVSSLTFIRVFALVLLCSCNALSMASTVVRGSRTLALARIAKAKVVGGTNTHRP